MKKKLKSFLFGVLVVLLFLSCGFTSKAETYPENEQIFLVHSVFYDQTTQNYCMYAADENGEYWIINIFQTARKDRNTLKWLNRILCNRWIIGIVENDGDIDQVIEWEFIN